MISVEKLKRVFTEKYKFETRDVGIKSTFGILGVPGIQCKEQNQFFPKFGYPEKPENFRMRR